MVFSKNIWFFSWEISLFLFLMSSFFLMWQMIVSQPLPWCRKYKKETVEHVCVKEWWKKRHELKLSSTLVYYVLPFYIPTRTVKRMFLNWKVRVLGFQRSLSRPFVYVHSYRCHWIRCSMYLLVFFVLGRRQESSKDTFVPTKDCTIHYHWCLRTKPTPYTLQPLSPCGTAVRYYFAEGWLALKLYHVKLNFVFVAPNFGVQS